MKVGDKVVIERWNQPDEIAVVSRETRTQFMVRASRKSEQKFYKQNGYAVGPVNASARIASKKDFVRIKQEEHRRKIESLIYSKVVAFEVFKRLETRTLENILALLEGKR